MDEKNNRDIFEHVFFRSDQPDSSSDAARTRITLYFLFTGTISLIIFGLLNIYYNSPIIGGVELSFALIGLMDIVYLRYKGNYELSARIMLVVMFALLIYLLISGGTEGTGTYWYFTYPVIAYLLFGSREGTRWVGLLGFSTVILAFLQEGGLITLYSDFVSVRQLVASLFVVSLMIYVFQRIIERTMVISERHAKENEQYIQQIKKEITDRESAEKELAKKTKIAEDTKSAVLNILEDLAEEKKNIEQLQARSQAMLTGIADGLIATDAGGRIVFVNNAFEDLLGWSEEEVIGKKLINVLPMLTEEGKPVATKDRLITKTLSEGKIKVTHTSDAIFYEKKNKDRLPVAITVSPIIIDSSVFGAVEVFRDITHELEIDRAKSEFVSLASHQLRTPLSTINWYAEMLIAEDVGKLSGEQKQFLEEIYKGNKRMVDLVNALLNVSRIDLGTFAVDPEEVNIAEIGEEILKELDHKIKEKKLVLKKKISKSLPMMTADRKLLGIVFQNLLSNAVKYTPEKGVVTLEVSSDKDNFYVSVSDTGYGIPKSQQDKIFTKLFRADNVRQKETDGTGLGLYIVKSIVDVAHGTITFTSKENKGTTFNVTLPKTGMKKKEGNKELSAS